MLSDQRSLFSLPDDLHYFNCAARGPLPDATRAVADAALLRQVVPTIARAQDYFRRPEELRTRIAGMLETTAERVAIVPAVSYGLAIATSNVVIPRGGTVVVPEEEFLSDVYGWIAACQRDGGVLRPVPRPSSSTDISARWSEAILDSIDDDTAVVNVSTVHWTDGLIFDVEAIGRRAREVGALFVVDATQSFGAMPTRFDRIGADLVLCASYKWLFGPYGLGVAIVGDRLIDGEPFEHHWSNRAGSEDTTGTEYLHEFRAGARRFDVGEHANDLPVSMLNASLEQVQRWGPVNIEGYCRSLLAPLEAYLAHSPYDAPDPSEHCAHILGFRSSDAGLMERAAAEAERRNIRLSRRGSALRVSPHLYNTPADVEALIEALAAAAR